MKRIVCPTDFSDTAQNAIAYAAKLAQVMHCDLTLLNVQSVFDFTLAEVFQGKEMSLAAASDQLESECRQIARAFRIGCYAEVESSAKRLSTVISYKARDYDLIVMGSNGADDLYQFFGGSNTYNAIVRSETPLMLVPAGYGYSDINKITYAFDYFRDRHLPLKGLAPIVNALKCELTVLQVMEDAFSKEIDDDLKNLQAIIRHFYRDEATFTYETVRSTETSQGINNYMLNNGGDALALCSVHRNVIQRLFHKSIIRNLTALSSYPVIVVHH